MRSWTHSRRLGFISSTRPTRRTGFGWRSKGPGYRSRTDLWRNLPFEVIRIVLCQARGRLSLWAHAPFDARDGPDLPNGPQSWFGLAKSTSKTAVRSCAAGRDGARSNGATRLRPKRKDRRQTKGGPFAMTHRSFVRRLAGTSIAALILTASAVPTMA